MEPYKPDENEARNYYRGLPSQPRLVARSSTNRWAPREPRGPFWPDSSTIKRLSVAGPHPIAQLWNDGSGPLRQDIIHALGGTAWTAIDVLRLGYDEDDMGDENHPITFFISVEPGSTTWEKGRAVVLQCKAILETHGIYGIHCEIKESTVIPAASPGSAPPNAPKLLSESINYQNDESEAELSDCLGVSIASVDYPDLSGTKGLYLRQNSPETSKTVFALTCRHVVFDMKVDNNEEYQHRPNMRRQAIVQPCNAKLRIMTRVAKRALSNSEAELAAIHAGFQQSSEEEAGKLTAEKAVLESCQDFVQRLEDLQNLETRIFGHVALAAPLSLRPPENQDEWLSDWALVELHQEKHQASLESCKNRVFVGASGARKLAEAQESAVDDFPKAVVKDGKVELQGTIRESEMWNPPALNNDFVPAIMVAKYGRTTKLTVGAANGIKSVTHHLVGEQEVNSEEWCIIGWRLEGEPMVPFSASGDSGACVWDLTGRIGGMLTSGTEGLKSGQDVTYATPIGRIIRDIGDHGLDVGLA